MKFFLLLLFFFHCSLNGASLVPLEDQISDAEALLTLAKILAQEEKTAHEALFYLDQLPSDSPQVQILKGEALTSLDQPKEAEMAFEKAENLSPLDPKLSVDLAFGALNLGHFKKAQLLFEKALLNNPTEDLLLTYAAVALSFGDTQLARELLSKLPPSLQNPILAKVLIAEERFEEAWHLLKDPQQQAYLALLKKDVFNTTPPPKPLEAEFFFKQGRFDQAALAYLKLANHSKNDLEKYKHLKMAALAEEKSFSSKKEALAHLVASFPNSPAARFFLAPLSLRNSFSFLESIFTTETSPKRLSDWSNLYFEEENLTFATLLQKQILAIDPHYFPALVQLAALLSTQQNFEEAIAIYQLCLQTFPESTRFRLDLARVLSWNKHYLASLSIYQTAPENPVFLREKARVEFWAKLANSSFSTYCQLLEKNLPSSLKKEVYLEYLAKKYAWDKALLCAKKTTETLLKEAPGNEEALFDLAQLNYSLGLLEKSQEAYANLLTISPHHTEAKIALLRQQKQTHPSLFFHYDFWREFGRQELSAIVKNHASLGSQLCFSDFSFRSFSLDLYFEHDLLYHQTFPSKGISFTYKKSFSPSFGIDWKISEKIYQTDHLRPMTLGYLLFRYRLKDKLLLQARLSRDSELYNYFGIIQGITSNSLELSAAYPVSHSLLLETNYKYLVYSDHNYLNLAHARVSFELSEHPKQSWIRLEWEWRNTAFLDRLIYIGPLLVDIIHPYWTPKRYSCGKMTFEHLRDFSSEDFAEGLKKLVGFQVILGSDTENDPFVEGIVDCRFDFGNLFQASIKGMAHGSPQWKAQGAWVSLEKFF